MFGRIIWSISRQTDVGTFLCICLKTHSVYFLVHTIFSLSPYHKHLAIILAITQNKYYVLKIQVSKD